jgi:hypothetical protein
MKRIDVDSYEEDTKSSVEMLILFAITTAHDTSGCNSVCLEYKRLHQRRYG